MPDTQNNARGTMRLQRLADVKTPRFKLRRVDGAEEALIFETASCQIGYHTMNDFVVNDDTVSRFHCELSATSEGVLVKDLGSANGTLVDGIRVKEAFLRNGSVVTVGRVDLRFSEPGDVATTRLSSRTDFGGLVGASPAMRECFGHLERAATTSRPVLLEGESGTGKSLAGEAIHELSSRAREPFLTIDCSAIAPAQLEATLFGRERDEHGPRRIGVFEEAGRGTVFLEEVGEVPLALQPRLVQVLEEGIVYRGDMPVPVHARVVTSSRRDLRTAVNLSTFRPELFFRLAVLRVVMPPLRARPDDLGVLVDTLAPRLNPTTEQLASFKSPEFMLQLQHSRWPGNVRELLNHLERCLLMGEPLPITDLTPAASERPRSVDVRLSYAAAREKALGAFEKEYLSALLLAHKGKVSAAARAADMDRVYMYRLLRRHGLKTKE